MIENNGRDSWKSRSGFLLAIVGSAVGLGSVWRFPYIAYRNGGGSFLIPYAIALLTVGIPLMVLELSVGHKFRASAPMAFKRIGRRWELLGWWMSVFVFAGVMFYYCVVLSWCANYIIKSFDLGWGMETGKFFEKTFLGKTSGPYKLGGINVPILAGLLFVWLANWIVVYKGVRKWIETASKIIVPVLGGMIIIFAVWCVTLPGAVKGIETYLKPDFNELMNLNVWRDAFSQMFFSLSLGFGILITYASYLPAKMNLKSSAVIACVCDMAFALIAGFAVFAILGNISQVSGKSISDAASKGPGLAFVVYPAAINLLPTGKQLFGTIFFLVLLIAGITSSVSVYETAVSSFIDKFGWSRKKVASLLAIIGFSGGVIFTTGAGIYWLDLIDFVLNNFGLLVAGLLESVAIGWVCKIRSIRTHIRYAVDKAPCPVDGIIEGRPSSVPGKAWEFAVIVWIPLVITLLIVLEILNQIKNPYSGYAWFFILPVGGGWLFMTVIVAWYLKNKGWKSPAAKEESI